MGFMTSHFDLYDFAYEHPANRDHANSNISHLPPHRILDEDPDVAGVGQIDESVHDDREQAKNGSGQSALGGMNAHVSLDAQAVAQHRCGPFQDLHQVSSGLLLHQHGRDHHLQVGGGYPASEL